MSVCEGLKSRMAEIKARAAERRADDERVYAFALLAECGLGKEAVKIDKIEAAMTRLDFGVERFEADVAALARREDLAAQLRGSERLREGSEERFAKWEVEVKTLKARLDEIERARADLRAELSQCVAIKAELNRWSAANQQLAALLASVESDEVKS